MAWAVIRRRQEWFKLAEKRGVHYTSLYFGISRKTYYKWWNRYKNADFDPKALQDQSRRPKTNPKTPPKNVVTQVIRLRKQTNYGPRRLQFFLQRDFNISLSVCGIYKILDRAGLIVRYKRKKKKFQSYAIYIKHPGQKVQIDVKYVPKQNGLPQFYQYQAKDLFTKLRFFRVYDEISAQNSVDFCKRLLQFFPFKIKCIQSDNGIEFTYTFLSTDKIHPLDLFCEQHHIKHKLIPVATPRYNGQVERGNRTDMEEFYSRAQWKSISELRNKMFRYLKYYNQHRPHMSIDMLSPIQKLNAIPDFQNTSPNFRCYP